MTITLILALVATTLAAPKAPGAPAGTPAPVVAPTVVVVVPPVVAPSGVTAPAKTVAAPKAKAAKKVKADCEEATAPAQWECMIGKHGHWYNWTEAGLNHPLTGGASLASLTGLKVVSGKVSCTAEGEKLDFHTFRCESADVAKEHNRHILDAYGKSAGLGEVQKKVAEHDVRIATLEAKVTTIEDGLGGVEEDSITREEVLEIVGVGREGLVDEESFNDALAKKAGLTEVAAVLATKADSEALAALTAGVTKNQTDLAETKKEVYYAAAPYANVGIGYAASMNLEGVALEADLGVELPWLRFGGNGFIAFAGDSHTFWGGTAGVYIANWDRIAIGKGGARFGIGPVAGYKRISLGNRDEDALTEAMGDAVAVGVGGFANIHTDSHFGGEIGFEITSDTGREIDVSTGNPERMPDVNGVGANVRFTAHFGGK